MPLPDLADPGDVADVWRPLSEDETSRVANLITKTSSKLRQKCPFNIDERMALFTTDPSNPIALDPAVVADVVATVVKRFLVNIEGSATSSETTGPFSKSTTWVNRYDKTGSDVRGAIVITDSDIEQLRPATPAHFGGTIRLRTPNYEQRYGSDRVVNVPDRYPGYGIE